MSNGNEPLIKSMSISQMYGLYSNRKLIVNRKYQRKLCWTIEEKRNLIDTIMNNLPVPMFLFAEKNKGDLEIIDGMQRLDAICSLIEQKYSLKAGFFDLQTMPDTIDFLRNNKLNQKGPILDPTVCRCIANYPLPVSVFPYDDSDKIEEAFKRINSTGKHLSLQELRQVGVNSKFSVLVRTLSSEVRGDISRDVLVLNEMSNISLSNYRLKYSIYTGDIFWVNNGIIGTDLLRASHDEEIVAYILANMILNPGERDAYNSENLNKYYGYDSNPLNTKVPLEMTKIENAVDRVSPNIIEKQFNTVFSVIKETLSKNKTIFRDCIFEKPTTSKDLSLPFQAIFMSIFSLIFREKLSHVDIMHLFRCLRGIGNELFTEDKIRDLRLVSKMQSATSYVSGKIRVAFSVSNIQDPAVDDWTMQCTNIIMKSRTEQNLYDFKIGFVTFGESKINYGCIDKILKTLTAINNIGPKRTGYIIVGIADNVNAAKDYYQRYNSEFKKVDDVFITGIDGEVKFLNRTFDQHTHAIKEYIRNTPKISEEYRTHILQNMFTPLFYGKQLVVFKTNYTEAVMYDGKLYQRLFSDVNLVDTNNYGLIYKKFYES